MLVVSLLALFVACWVWFFVRRICAKEDFRWRNGYCINCGYDVHFLTEPRCPECGTVFNHRPISQ